MIDVKSVSKTYNKRHRNANKVLDSASVQLPDSGFVFFVGRSGSGKSTILNAIGGLISYDGEILYDQKKVNIEKYRPEHIGYIFQNFLLFDDLSILENIRYSLNLIGIYDETKIRKRTSLLMQAVGLEMNLNRRVRALSLGQRQRIAIARALASNPRVILADEPTGNLDSKNSIIVMNILKRLSKNHLIICVTHNLGIVNKYADKIYQIKDKKLLEIDGSKAEDIKLSSITQNINVAKMSQSEFKSKDFIVKLFSQNSSDKSDVSELKIIRKNGKILVIGDNISIISKEEAEIAGNDDSENDNVDKNDSEIVLPDTTETESVTLDFENTKEKKPFKDWHLYKSFIAYSKANTKSFKSFLVRFSNAFFPLVIFILFSIMIGQLSVLTGEANIDYHENFITMVTRDSTHKTLSSFELAKIIDDEDSHIVGTRQSEYSLGINLDDETDWSENYALPFSSFSIMDNMLSPDYSSDYNDFTFNVSDAERYASFDFAKEFDNYQMADGDILIDQKLIDQFNEKQLDPIFINHQALQEAIIGTKLTINLTSSASQIVPFNYTITGIVDTGYPSFYANSSTFQEIAYNLRNSYNNSYAYGKNYYDFPTMAASLLDEYTFVEYDDVSSNPRYDIFGSVDVDPYELESGVPLVLLSNNIELSSGDYSSILGNLQSISTGYIIDTLNPDAKIFCFKDFQDSNGNFNDSSSYAFGTFLEKLESDCNVALAPDDLTILEGDFPSDGGDIIIPYSMRETFDRSIINNIEYNSNSNYRITGYYDDALTGTKTIYTSSLTYLASSLPNIYLYYNESIGEITVSSTYVLSDNIEETQRYFQENDDLGIDCYIFDDVYRDYNSNQITDILSTFVQSIVVTLLIFLVITVMSNLSKVNKSKAKFGILRCLGYSKWSLVKQNSAEIFVSMFYYTLIPCAIVGILMGLFNLYTLGWLYSIVFFFGYAFINLLTSNIPLLILLRKKPVEIVNSLN